jgi:hypothetical protein
LCQGFKKTRIGCSLISKIKEIGTEVYQQNQITAQGGQD